MDIDYQHKIKDITNWISETVQSAGINKVVVAVSGGVDSAVSTALAVRALGKENVSVLMLPYGELNRVGVEHAQKLLDTLLIPLENRTEINIQSSVEEILKSIQGNASDVRKGNIMARVRMTYLFDSAKKQGALVIGTENKSEHLLGYYTRFGDEASDIEPIRSLYKTQVWEIAKLLNVPQEIIAKAPTAGLWETQTDEGEFGFSYIEADKILYLHFDKGMSKEEIINSGIDSKTVEKVLDFVAKNNFKHNLPKIFE